MQVKVSKEPQDLLDAERVIFPGVGAAGPAMKSLLERGLDHALLEVLEAGVPVLGICLGLQIALDHSQENDTNTLGLIAGNVQRFNFKDPSLKIPHMGWNEVKVVKPHPVLADIEQGDEFYFVHGYYPQPKNKAHVLAKAHYETDFCCAVGLNNYVGTQFHPEKSGRVGLRLIEKFSRWDGQC